MLKLNEIKAHPGATSARKRLGRGQGSGLGATAGKGDKGQLARSGGSVRAGFEGGQMPLYRRIPKRGFTNIHRRATAEWNVGQLQAKLPAQLSEVNLATLAQAGLITERFDRLAILSVGEIKRAIQVKAHRVSEAARAKIEKAGGQVELIPIPGPQPRAKRQKKAKKS